jgi:Tol biopolymer transport system component
MLSGLKAILLSLLLLVIIRTGFAQFDPNPELEWFTIETDHFYIHYSKGTERTANTVAKIAEEIYGPITKLYNYTPKDKTSWIINDESDYSNGATDYYGNRIEIQAAALDFDLRGTHNWLRNVITHEFTHVIQVPSSMKFGTKLPSIYLQYLNYEPERRPDVLYGYPNVIISYPISGVGVPSWYAEGTAQYQRQQTGYDYWDANRDMILRMRTLNDNLLTWEEMGQFASVTTYKAESIYNQGLALIRYIANTYGENKLKEISGYMSNPLTFNCESAFKKAIGKSGSDLYKEWKTYLKKDYEYRVANIKPYKTEGEEIAKVGFANYFPQFSPDGKKVAYLSNKEYDYGSTTLYLHYNDNRKEDEALVPAVSGGFCWTPDGKKIIYSRRNIPTIYDRSIFDLYEYDLSTEKTKQITFNIRAHAPAISADGKNICFVRNNDGTQNLFMASSPKGDKLKDIKQLTKFTNGEQVYSPKWSPDGLYIVFDYSKHDCRSIAKIETSSGQIEFLFDKPDVDFRSPVFSPDGSSLFIASDMTGIFNIYKYEWINEARMSKINDRMGNLKQVTNVIGGAFMPNADSSGNLVYSSWQSTGYKISELRNYSDIDSLVAEKDAKYIRPEKVLSKYANENSSNSSEPKNQFSWDTLKNFKDDNPEIHRSTSYRNVATPLFIIPVIRFDAYKKGGTFWDALKPGLYFYSQDVLGKMGIFGGASINKNFERDLFLQFDYNNGVPFFKDFFLKKLSFAPHFQLAGYNISRKTSADLVAGLDTIPVDVTYDLLQFDFDMAFKIINSNHTLKAGFTLSKYSSQLGTFLLKSANAQVPSTSTNYFTGRDLSLTYSFSSFTPNRNEDINPLGRYIKLKYDYEFNNLNPTLVVNDQGNVVEQFQYAKFHRLETDIFQGFGLFNNSHSLSFRLRGGTIFGPPQDNFFDFYASGFPGMKGYPFYAIGGSRYASANITYRLPVAENLNFNFLQFYFDKLYFSVYGDFGNAWTEKATKLKDFKKDVGFEVRLQAFSYYVYPTAFAFNAAYGIDQFSRIFPSTTNEQKVVTYGKEWRFYFTVLFGFDFFIDAAKNMRF